MTGHSEERPPEPARTATVKVPGARLFYQVRGSGPFLIMLCGGAAGAGGFDTVVPYLATDYTVITYDRRGLSRSPLDDPGEDPAITIAAHSEDVHRILTVLGAAPAMVFGSSIGALIGLDLLIRHPGDVRVLVAHEPPIGSLLTRSEKPAVSLAEIYERTGDADETMRQAAVSLAKGDLAALAPDRRGDSKARSRNNEFFLRNDAPAAGRYELDLDTLNGLTSQVVIGGGRGGREFFPYVCASRLAERLGISLREFPGNHGGFAIYPAEFARSLRQVLRTRRILGAAAEFPAPFRPSPPVPSPRAASCDS